MFRKRIPSRSALRCAQHQDVVRSVQRGASAWAPGAHNQRGHIRKCTPQGAMVHAQGATYMHKAHHTRRGPTTMHPRAAQPGAMCTPGAPRVNPKGTEHMHVPKVPHAPHFFHALRFACGVYCYCSVCTLTIQSSIMEIFEGIGIFLESI